MLPHLHVYVIDIAGRALRVPRLHATSATPPRRMRHASSVVRTPEWARRRLPAGSPVDSLPSVLVLGGACDGGGPGADPPPGQERGEPVPGGLLTLTLLSFCTTDGSEVQWQEIDAHGTAPSIGLWHHQAAPFDGGEKVCVFGGDMPREDAEFDLIADRQAANLIYVLHVGARRWERVRTFGDGPSWRSLHVGLACQPPCQPPTSAPSSSSASPCGARVDHLLVLGGSDEHVRPFSSGDCADFKPYLLNLQTLTWRTRAAPEAARDGGLGGRSANEVAAGGIGSEAGGEEAAAVSSFAPRPRMRFAAEAYGPYVLLYSGHGDSPIPAHEQILRLDLATLQWRRMTPRNRPVSLSETPAACLAGGVMVGGVQMGFMGIRPCPKLDLLCLAEPPEDDGFLGGGELVMTEGAAAGEGGKEAEPAACADVSDVAAGGSRSSGSTGADAGSSSSSSRVGVGLSAAPAAASSCKWWEGSPKWREAPSDDDEEERALAEAARREAEEEEEMGSLGAQMVQVEMTAADGSTRSMRLPLALVARLMQAQAQGEQAGEHEDEEDGEEDGEGDEDEEEGDDDGEDELAAAMQAHLGAEQDDEEHDEEGENHGSQLQAQGPGEA